MKKTLMIFAALIVAAASCKAADIRAGGDITLFRDSSKAPFATFLYDRTPEIRRVDQNPSRPVAGEGVKIGAQVVANPLRASLPVKSVFLFKSGDDGKTWEKIEMLRSDSDADYYFAFLPPQAAGASVRYYIRAENTGGGVSTEAPFTPGGHPAGAALQYVGADDSNDDDDVVPADIDILRLEAAQDDKYLYVRLILDGIPGKGDAAKNGAYLYFMPIIDFDSYDGGAGILNVPMLTYAPILANFLNMPASGLFRISELMDKKTGAKRPEVKMKKGEHDLSFRLEKKDVLKKENTPIGMAALTAAVKAPDNILPWEASPYLTLYPQSHEFKVAAAPESTTFRAGAGEADITPPAGTPLAGYGDRKGAPSTGVHDPLMVEALVLEAGNEKYALVTADFFYPMRRFCKDVAIAVERETGIPRDHVLISASHSHSSSGGMFAEVSILGGAVSPGLYEKIRDQFVKAIKEADSNLVPAVIGITTKEVTGFNGNRRQSGGPTDPNLSVMRVDSLDGKPIAVYYNFSAHPTMMGGDNLSFSADWPGAVRKKLAGVFPGAHILFVNGSLGNMSPSCPGDCGSGFDAVNSMGEKFGEEIAKIVKETKTSDKLDFTFVTKEILVHPEYNLWITMSALRFGDAVMVTEPGEIYVEVGFPVRERAKELGMKACFIMGLTNDGIGYIIPEEWYKKHVYEATFSMYGPKEGEFIKEQMLSLLGQVSGGAAK